MLIDWLHKIATIVLRRAQRCLGASTVGVRALVINAQGDILLVKHTYISGWHFPGGGVDAGETQQHAVIREIHEEAGIVNQGELVLFGTYYHQVRGVDDYVSLFIIKAFTQEPFSSVEIADTCWVKPSALPTGTSRATQDRLKEFFDDVQPSEYWKSPV